MLLGCRAFLPQALYRQRPIRCSGRVHRWGHRPPHIPLRLYRENWPYVPIDVPLPPLSHANIAKDAEALQILYNPSEVTYERLLEFFFQMHDPTTVDRQGPDVGSQYRSAIFFHNDQQEKAARRVLEKAQEQWYKVDMATQVIPAGEWWDAEDYHQLYLDNSEFFNPTLGCLMGERGRRVLTVGWQTREVMSVLRSKFPVIRLFACRKRS